jgi:hypothetical protein
MIPIPPARGHGFTHHGALFLLLQFFNMGLQPAIHARCLNRAPRCRHEQELASQGNSKQEIRTPRYMATGDEPPDYPDGSKSVSCALCPIKRGLFKQSAGREHVWVHNVCALWQAPEVIVPQVDHPDIVRTPFAL